jgi:hypothetical protein
MTARDFSSSYLSEVNITLVHVCKDFFLVSLNVGKDCNIFMSWTQKHSPSKRKFVSTQTSQLRLRTVLNHTKSFPDTKSHWYQASTHKCLDVELAISKVKEV